jgi:hypothetical protein
MVSSWEGDEKISFKNPLAIQRYFLNKTFSYI